ncbi:uncharacterized protein V1518DRAFT_409962 [Limtongia smithiae]|uniref:uncharacterized protein n=1 Tax=Limtongia smithiae TaxID=1125753 RepID=UPI0034CD65E5
MNYFDDSTNVCSDDEYELIELIERQFLQRVPARQFVWALTPGDKLIHRYNVQSVLCTKAVANAVYVKGSLDAGSATYTLSILRVLIEMIEQSGDEVHESIYEMAMIALNASRELAIPTTAPVVYKFVNPGHARNFDKITIAESRNLISAYGTTGFRTWEAALALGEYLLLSREIQNGHPLIVREKRVLDLGTGTGFLGLLCAKLGAKKVYASDGVADLLLRVRANLGSNGFTDTAAAVVETPVYKWGGISEQRAQSGHELERESNAKEFVFDKPVDIIFGADVVSIFCGVLSLSLLTRADFRCRNIRSTRRLAYRTRPRQPHRKDCYQCDRSQSSHRHRVPVIPHCQRLHLRVYSCTHPSDILLLQCLRN